jgi:hypothetical protein
VDELDEYASIAENPLAIDIYEYPPTATNVPDAHTHNGFIIGIEIEFVVPDAIELNAISIKSDVLGLRAYKSFPLEIKQLHGVDNVTFVGITVVPLNTEIKPDDPLKI